MLVSSIGYKKVKTSNDVERHAQPYCKCTCWNQNTRRMEPSRRLQPCSCGEEDDDREWKWEPPAEDIETGASLVTLSEDQKQVMFHPVYSSGTAVVRGDTALQQNHHYYWEVKMLSDAYGTDIMVGVGSNKVEWIQKCKFAFKSMLGHDPESYGLSYTGSVQHNATFARGYAAGFCRGTIIGVRLDLWQGTLEFYLNRKPQGIAFYNLRRHDCLYPMLCSTAAQSSMRLIYATSWQASLLVDAAKILAASVSRDRRLKVPPGLWYRLRSQFWLTLAHEGCSFDEDQDPSDDVDDVLVAEPIAESNVMDIDVIYRGV